jgi:hypothetical protein
MLNVTYELFILRVTLLNVVMLSVVKLSVAVPPPSPTSKYDARMKVTYSDKHSRLQGSSYEGKMFHDMLHSDSLHDTLFYFEITNCPYKIVLHYIKLERLTNMDKHSSLSVPFISYG